MENTEVHIFNQIFSRRIKCIQFDQLAKEPSYYYIETNPIKFMLYQFDWFIPWGLRVCERYRFTHLAGGATGIALPLGWTKTMLIQMMSGSRLKCKILLHGAMRCPWESWSGQFVRLRIHRQYLLFSALPSAYSLQGLYQAFKDHGSVCCRGDVANCQGRLMDP